MRRSSLFLIAVATVAGVAIVACSSSASGRDKEESAPIYGIKIPPGYRDWTLISVARVGGTLNDLRAKLGNDVAINAYREGKTSFPEGAIIARLAWKQDTSEENNKALRPLLERGLDNAVAKSLLAESFIAGPPTNVQFMVKDSKKYASAGGWGFAQFTNGKPDGEDLHKTCFPCHAPAKDRDFVFTRYAP